MVKNFEKSIVNTEYSISKANEVSNNYYVIIDEIFKEIPDNIYVYKFLVSYQVLEINKPDEKNYLKSPLIFEIKEGDNVKASSEIYNISADKTVNFSWNIDITSPEKVTNEKLSIQMRYLGSEDSNIDRFSFFISYDVSIQYYPYILKTGDTLTNVKTDNLFKNLPKIFKPLNMNYKFPLRANLGFFSIYNLDSLTTKDTDDLLLKAIMDQCLNEDIRKNLRSLYSGNNYETDFINGCVRRGWPGPPYRVSTLLPGTITGASTQPGNASQGKLSTNMGNQGLSDVVNEAAKGTGASGNTSKPIDFTVKTG